MEPIQSTTAAESTPPPADTAPDPQLQHATETLAGQMGGGGAGPEAGLDAPETRPEGEEQATQAQRRLGSRQQATQSWQRRQEARNRELRERRALQEQYEARMAETNRLAAQALEALRAGRPPVQEEPEEIPDPVLDPPGFYRWLQAQNQRAIQEALKPITEAEQARQQAQQQRWQESQRSEAQNEAIAARREMQDDWMAAYRQDAPDLAAGFDDRYVFMHERVSGAWSGLAQPGDEATLTNLQFGAVMRYAEEVGTNPVMFLDAWFENLAGQFGWGLAGAPAGSGSASAPVHQPAAAAASEVDRLAKVRARANGATSAAPRQPGRATTTRSELQDLLRAGVSDINQLRAAALKDSGGNMQQAAVMLAQAAGKVA